MGFNDTSFATAPLPLGFAYRTPNRIHYAEGFNYTAQSEPLLDPPTPFDAQMATCLRADIPANPQDPTLPDPAWVRAFVFAMSPAGVGVTNANGELAAHPGGVELDGSDPAGRLAVYARGAGENSPTWPLPQPGEGWNLEPIRKAFAAFRWYGPLPNDVETPEGVKYYDGWGDGITKERYIYWYAIDDDGNWNRCQQIQGWNGSEWVLPTKWGTYCRAWLWRPTDGSNPHNVGEWRVFFNFDNWMNENKATFAAAAFWVSAIIVSVATLGSATPATVTAAAAATAFLVASQSLFKSAMSNDPGKMVASIVEMGKSFNTLSGGDFAAAVKRDNPGLAKFAESVAAPFQKVYEAAGSAIQNVYAMWEKAQALRGNLPPMGQAAWGSALQAIGGGRTAGLGAWLQMSRLPSTANVAAQLWENAPSWAKDVVALGTTMSSVEQAQLGNQATSVKSSLYNPKGTGGGGYMQVSPQTVEVLRKFWGNVPPKPKNASVPVFNPNMAGPAPMWKGVPVAVAVDAKLSTPAKVAIGVTLGALLLSQLQTYAVGKVLDRVVDKVIP